MANLKDLIVNGSARILGTIYGNLTGNVTGNCSGSSGSCTGNAATATKATQDASGNVITSTYVNLTGAQTISGAKTFSSTITGSVSGSAGSCTGTAAKATADASGNTITTTYATKTELSAKADSSSLATVATSGSYDDLSNKPTIPTQLITTYVSGTSGYNIWSNGYCEQWGRETALTSSIWSDTQQIKFSKTFANTNYQVYVAPFDGSMSAGSNRFTITVSDAHTDYCYIRLDGQDRRASYVSWKVSGYLASGQY